MEHDFPIFPRISRGADRAELLRRVEDGAKEGDESGDIVDRGIGGDGLCLHKVPLIRSRSADFRSASRLQTG